MARCTEKRQCLEAIRSNNDDQPPCRQLCHDTIPSEPVDFVNY